MASFTRRQFIVAGAKVAALAAVPAILRFDPVRAFAGPDESAVLADYLSWFEVDETLIRRVMATALERGGDYCDLFFEHTVSNYVGLQDNAVNRAGTSVDYGVGIRVIEGDRTGFSFTEELTAEAMLKAARTAANIARSGSTEAPSGLLYKPAASYYPIQVPWEDIGIDRKIPILQHLDQQISGADSRIVKTSVTYRDATSRILVATSEGIIRSDYRPMAEISASCSAEQNGRREEGWYSLTSRNDISFFSPETMNLVSGEAVRRTLNQLDAIQPEGGEMPVVLAAGGSGMMLHEAIGHGMEADCNRRNESIYSDAIGKPIAEPIVSIVDDGTYPHARGSINIDDEGSDTEKTFLVRDGILQSYMHDLISAKHYGVRPTGNGRRESFRYPPVPRMRSTYMLPGPHTKDEIIASVKKGVYCDDFTNGEVRIGPGDFTFYVKSGYLIEDGKLTRPIKDVNLIGNGPEVLKRVTMVADDFALASRGGTCGKDGQWVPVSMGLPTILVSALTVGGKSA